MKFNKPAIKNNSFKINQKHLTKALFLILFIITLIPGCKKERTAFSANQQREKKILSLVESSENPANIIQEEILSGKDIIFSEIPGYKENLELFKYLIPSIYDAGITSVGVWFLEDSKQSEIDNFLNGNTGNKERAEEILNGENPLTLYNEYTEFILYVSQFNSNLNKGEKPIRLIGLSSHGNFSNKGYLLLTESHKESLPDSAEGNTETGLNNQPDSEIPDTKQPPIPSFIWWNRENIYSVKTNFDNSVICFLHNPPFGKNSSDQLNDEPVIFEKAILLLNPFDHIKAVKNEDFRKIVSDSPPWDFYIINGPATLYNTMKSEDQNIKEYSSQRVSDIKRLKKAL